ncbi:MAG: hypothetical protein NDJ90_05480 [Oligoflexia bacterium]|nr:hypothetical protein [Oligoflexia bacterium]
MSLAMLDRFSFRGFQPSANFEAEASRALAELLSGAPADTSCLGSIEQGPQGFVARVDLYSNDGPFLADAVASTPEEAFARVVTDLRARLAEWHERRAS